jgi:CBS domain-containing protein
MSLPPAETVRALLSWFGAERRGYWKVREIRKALNKLKLRTEPDFEEAWINAPITFVPKSKPAPSAEQAESGVEEAGVKVAATVDSVPVPGKVTEDPAGRIGRLEAANRRPLCLPPDADIAEAITLMMQHDYSQLPVTTTERDVKGMLSWKSLGSRLALDKKCKQVRECMDAAYDIYGDSSLLEAIQVIIEHECVLVRDTSRLVTGIVTTADLSKQLKELGEPFLLLGQIENHVRGLIADKYSKGELSEARDPADSNREIEDVADLTLGEYVRLLENPKRWGKLCLLVDRKRFCGELTRVLQIRNDVMHFDPDPISDDDLTALRKSARFLAELQKKLL